MYQLYLDDLRKLATKYPNPVIRDWVIARNYDQFVEVLDTKGLPSFVSFDFDLGHAPNAASTGKKTGLDCAVYMLNKCLDEQAKMPKWHVHSANPNWAERLRKFLVVCEKTLNT